MCSDVIFWKGLSPFETASPLLPRASVLLLFFFFFSRPCYYILLHVCPSILPLVLECELHEKEDLLSFLHCSVPTLEKVPGSMKALTTHALTAEGEIFWRVQYKPITLLFSSDITCGVPNKHFSFWLFVFLSCLYKCTHPIFIELLLFIWHSAWGWETLSNRPGLIILVCFQG